MCPDVSHQVRETSASLRLPELPLVDEKRRADGSVIGADCLRFLESLVAPVSVGRFEQRSCGQKRSGALQLGPLGWAPGSVATRLYAAIIVEHWRQFDKTSSNPSTSSFDGPHPPSQRLFQHPPDIVLKFRMMANQADYKNREFLAVIGDEDSVTGLLLAGIGHVTTGADAQKNFLVVDSKTDNAAIESAFNQFTQERKDIGIVLINQHIADRIRHCIDTYTAAFPTVLEIPSKDHPYDPEKDSVLRRVRRLFGE
ncbi:hypothetical protein E4U09_000504 [Claviceps aff. purpurea]|nr:hypothetical protein E4U09_000504 [Claviceps aff. purpurea]